MNEYPNLTEVSYLKIKAMVDSGTLPPGGKINKRIMAEYLGISSTPITEALKKLQGEGFVEYRSRVGYFVKLFSDEERVEFFEIRAALEGMAVWLMIQQATDKEKQKILSFWEGQEQLSDTEYHKKDKVFHKKIVIYSHNSILADTWIKAEYAQKTSQQGLLSSRILSAKDHHGILEAVRTGDAEKGLLIMREHFLRVANHIRKGFIEKNDL